jgi:hypothetical protein
MQGELDPGAIRPGMPVYGVDGVPLGEVEAVEPDRAIRVLTHKVPPAAIDYVDEAGVHLQVARAAFVARRPETREARA